MVGVPTLFEMRPLLELWLVEVPRNTVHFWQYVSDDADRGYAHFRLRLGEPGDGKDRHLYNRHLYAQAAYSPFELVGVREKEDH